MVYYSIIAGNTGYKLLKTSLGAQMKIVIIIAIVTLFLAGCWGSTYHMGPHDGQRMHRNMPMGNGPHM